MRGAGEQAWCRRQELRKSSSAHSPPRDSAGQEPSCGNTQGERGRRRECWWDEGPLGGGRTNDPFPRQLYPLQQLSETAPEKEAATSLRAPDPVVPTLVPGCRQRAQRGQRLSAAAKRAGMQVTRPPGQGREGGHSGRELAPDCGRSSTLRQLPWPRGRGRARCASPEPGPPEPSAAAYLAPGGRRGAHSRSGRGSVRRRGARSGRTRVARGGKGRGGPCGESRDGSRRAAPVRTVRHPWTMPAPPPPAPVAGRPAWAEGFFVSKLP